MRILWITLILASMCVVSCSSSKRTGGLGGLSPNQAEEFSDLQNNWSDARAAYNAAVGSEAGIETNPNRSRQMARRLVASHCTASKTGNPDFPLNQSGGYEHQLQGQYCAISADETVTFTKTDAGGVISVSHTYTVGTNPDGISYQTLNPLQSFTMNGSFTSSTKSNTTGSFTFTVLNAGDDPTAPTAKGKITIIPGVATLTITFATWTLTAQVLWTSSFTHYLIQGIKVDPDTFHAAFADFRVPEIVGYAQRLGGGASVFSYCCAIRELRGPLNYARETFTVLGHSFRSTEDFLGRQKSKGTTVIL